MFNSGGYWRQAQRGQLQQRLIADRHPSLPKANEPLCTRSQIIAYLTPQGQRVAVVHQYLRPDGTLGASGRPDPKTLLVSGVLHRAVEP